MAVSSTVGVQTQKIVRVTSTSAFVVPGDVTIIEIILVAGGGAGGSGTSVHQGACAGGGGGGGFIETFLNVSPSSSHTITIGAGGAAQADQLAGANGSNSTFGSLLTAIGGGGGGGYGSTYLAKNGGSGGGEANIISPGQSNIGGGGGGANAASTKVSLFHTTDGVQGSPGFKRPTIFDNQNDNVLKYSELGSGGLGLYNLAGGGGGAVFQPYSSNVFASGKSGGGRGSNVFNNFAVDASTGVANTGGGGGGGTYHNRLGLAAAGGSGIAIIKYWSAL